MLKISFNKDNYLYEKFGKKDVELFIDEDVYIYEFEDVLNDSLNKAIITPKDYFENDSIIVTNINRDFKKDIEAKEYIAINRKEKEKSINTLCHYNRGVKMCLPEIMYIEFKEEFQIHDKIKSILIKKTIDASLKCISNFTDNTDDKEISTIIGAKNIIIKYQPYGSIYTEKAYNNLYDLYIWGYSSCETDKISVIRNVISILIAAKYKECDKTKFELILEHSEWLKKSCEDNFEVIIKGNINEFFKEKSNIMNSLKGNMIDLNKSLNDIIKTLNLSITTGVGATVAASFGYIAKKDIDMIKVVIFIYGIFLIVNTIINLPAIYFSKSQILKMFESNSEKYKKEFLEDAELKSIDKIKNNNVCIFWIYFIGSILLIILIVSILCIILQKLNMS